MCVCPQRGIPHGLWSTVPWSFRGGCPLGSGPCSFRGGTPVRPVAGEVPSDRTGVPPPPKAVKVRAVRLLRLHSVLTKEFVQTYQKSCLLCSACYFYFRTNHLEVAPHSHESFKSCTTFLRIICKLHRILHKSFKNVKLMGFISYILSRCFFLDGSSNQNAGNALPTGAKYQLSPVPLATSSGNFFPEILEKL